MKNLPPRQNVFFDPFAGITFYTLVMQRSCYRNWMPTVFFMNKWIVWLLYSSIRLKFFLQKVDMCLILYTEGNLVQPTDHMTIWPYKPEPCEKKFKRQIQNSVIELIPKNKINGTDWTNPCRKNWTSLEELTLNWTLKNCRLIAEWLC